MHCPSVLPLIAGALLCAAAAAGAADYPKLKPGQWEMTTTTDRPGTKPQKSTICFDAALQQEMLEMGNGMRKELCSRSDVRQVGAQFITDAECKIGNSVVKSHSVMTMLGDSAYRTEASATYDPPLFNDLKASKTVVEATHLGACKDGLVPGDIVTATGQKINMRQLRQDRATMAK
jgi:hypothetical protein